MNVHELTSFSSALWTVFANHLWQSTLFAAVAAVMTLVLRKNQAQVRYWIWLIASMKFLLPFSWLISLGSHLAPKAPANAVRLAVVMQEMGEPFATASHAHAASPAGAPVAAQLVPVLLLLGWFAGFLAVLLFWWQRWRRMMTVIHEASLLESGRELEMLRRLEQVAGKRTRIRLMISRAALEPGVVGILRPIMLLPEGIAERLTDAQLEAILTHELCHVRRRDNLAAALHMLMEATFWFHPLVWWMGARLVAERERACDEAVLQLGHPPQAYAEGILNVCKFYLESPLACVAGVTGSNLKRRIEAIMIHRIASKLNLAKKLLLTAAAISALAVPIIFGVLHPQALRAQQAQSTAPAVFEDVSLTSGAIAEPGKGLRTRFWQNNGVIEAQNLTLRQLIRYAYGSYVLSDSQVAGGPEWISSDLYDLKARFSKDLGGEESRIAMQNFLSQRFKLVLHHELKDSLTYELVLDRNGSRLSPTMEKDKRDRIEFGPGMLKATNTNLERFARYLQNYTGSIVVDKTGLTGSYDFTLTAEGLSIAGAKSHENIAALIKALPEQLGLELNSQTRPVDTLVIDHVEKPAIEGKSEGGSSR